MKNAFGQVKCCTGQSATFLRSIHFSASRGGGWTAYGVCVEGPMKGTRLKPLILEPEFWFAWSEFHPQTPSVRLGIRALTFDPQRGRDLRAAT